MKDDEGMPRNTLSRPKSLWNKEIPA